MLDLHPSSNKIRCDANIAYCNSNTSDTTLVRPYPMMVLKALIEYQEITYDTAACKMFSSYARWPPTTTRPGSVRRKCDRAKVTHSLSHLGGVVDWIPGYHRLAHPFVGQQHISCWVVIRHRTLSGCDVNMCHINVL